MQIKNVLIIDDDEVASTLLLYLIEDILQVEAANIRESGAEGFDYLLQAADAGNFPELIILDLNMPHMSGYEFIRQYEQQYSDRFPCTQLVVLTSSLLKEDQEVVMARRSVAGFFRKPLTEAELRYLQKKAADN